MCTAITITGMCVYYLFMLFSFVCLLVLFFFCLFFFSFGTNSKNRHHNKNYSNSKPWFTKDCKTKRDAFHGVKNKYKTDKSDETKFLLKEKS